MKQAKAHLDKVDVSKGFLEGTVSSNKLVTATVERCWLIMNSSEYTRYFGRGRKKSKDRHYHLQLLLMRRGEDEEVYLFKDPSNPWRRLKLSTSVQEEEAVLLMSPVSHLHEEQGPLTRKATTSKRLSTGRMDHLLQHGQFCTVSEYKFKLEGSEKKLVSQLQLLLPPRDLPWSGMRRMRGWKKSRRSVMMMM